MNKKIVALFLFVFCVVAVVAIGVFGKVPDPASIIRVERIYFIDPSRPENDFECEVNEDGEKVIKIQRGNETYQLHWRIEPENATDKKVSFVKVANGDFFEIDANGLITFKEEVSVTVKIQSNLKDLKSDTVNIEFIGKPSSEEENPF
ncbi:MAG TPA: hypothetical protein VIK96_02135 [Bacilli bacterium]